MDQTTDLIRDQKKATEKLDDATIMQVERCTYRSVSHNGTMFVTKAKAAG